MHGPYQKLSRNSPLLGFLARVYQVLAPVVFSDQTSYLRASAYSVVDSRSCRSYRGLISLILGVLISLLALPTDAAKTPDDTILIDLTINHGVAYREGSWVPVDVLINNTERDVDGRVEVRIFDFSNQLLSPIYQVPAISPKDSKKKFRLYCKLERASRMEVQLYHGNRATVPVPTWLNLTPIERKDYLGLVLDDQHHDYGFLSHEHVIGRAGTRFHREGLATEELGLLSDYLPCYTNFDLIVMGNIDPERIAPEHRTLIQQYVELGGTLAVNLGQNANRYKGSWVEPLMGVSIGESTFTNENDLAGRSYGIAGAESREGTATAISPASDTVRSLGNDFVVGAVNPVGLGRVATFNVDAVSGLLQNSEPFLREWNNLLTESIVERPLNISAIIDAAVQRLPAIAGVKLFPVSSVIAYLLLYFFVAIVGNWLFWNKIKRREMAWVCLVFFSLAFTSYAMIFGTQGRARSTELEQLEILELSANSPNATLHGVTGLLAKGSGRFEGKLTHPQTLISDAATAVNSMYTGNAMFGSQGQSPFQFVQGELGAVKNIAVGASEMRFLQSRAPLELPGELETHLSVVDGNVRGTIDNRTGLELQRPTILYDGWVIPVKLGTGINEINLGAQDSITTRQIPPGDAMTVPDRVAFAEKEQFSQFLTEMPEWLLSGKSAAPPPCLVAWVDGPPIGSIDLGNRANAHLGAQLAIAWLDIGQTAAPEVLDVAVTLTNPQFAQFAVQRGMPYGMSLPPQTSFARGLPVDRVRWDEMSRPINFGESWELDFTLPAWTRAESDYVLEIKSVTANTAYRGTGNDFAMRGGLPREADAHHNCVPVPSSSSRARMRLVFGDRENSGATLPEPKVSTMNLDGDGILTTETYTITDWKGWLVPRTSTIELRALNAASTDADPVSQARFQADQDVHYHAFVAAQLIKSTPKTAGE